MLVFLSCAAGSRAASAADFYVSPRGNDAWTGTAAVPSASDGPFATLERARVAVRQLKEREPDRKQPVRVQLRGGMYYLDQTVTFGPEDGGSAEATVVYEAYPGEEPVLSGGCPVRGWRESGGQWTVRLPEVERGEWYFSQLFVNGERRYRPRLPKQGYYFVAGETPPTQKSAGKGWDSFRFRAGEIDADWANLGDVEGLVFHQWSMSRLRIESVDRASRVVTFSGHSPSTSTWASIAKNNRYLLDNVAEALSDPGEWYLDRKTGVLTYIPLAGEYVANASVIAPRLERIIEIRGDAAAKKPVSGLVFRGLTFAHTQWNNPPEGYACSQAEAVLGGAIFAEYARDCVLDQCRITHTGAWALELGAGCKNNRIENCVLTDLGAGGVKIGLQGYQEDEEAVASDNAVRNCLIAHGGRIHPAATGVWMGHSHHNHIAHNEIHDFYYTGISVGWSWGYGRSQAHHNVMEYNHIHHIGQSVLSDMGGIYSLGLSPGSVERGNVIHDVNSYSYGGWGIYFDEGTTGMLAEDNIVYRCKTGGFHQHYGRENIVRNNIFALAPTAGQLIRTRNEEHLSFTIERNIVYWNQAPLLGSNWQGGDPPRFVLNRNIYWNAGGEPVLFAGKTLDEWRQTGHDAESIVADPRFKDPDNGDFTLLPGSPAGKIGFKALDASRAGLSRALAFQDKPAPRAFPEPPEGPPPVAVHEDFEYLKPGDRTPDATTSEENDVATARVTDETASSGRHSLKFTDAPGQKHEFNPHVFFDPNFREGVLKGTFDLRVEAGAVLYNEWRDASSPYNTGPALYIGADGRVRAGQRVLAAIPHGKWVHFEITAGVGAKASGKWSLTMQAPGADLMRFQDLPCSPDFRTLRWMGWTANGTQSAVFYLDNIHLDLANE